MQLHSYLDKFNRSSYKTLDESRACAWDKLSWKFVLDVQTTGHIAMDTEDYSIYCYLWVHGCQDAFVKTTNLKYYSIYCYLWVHGCQDAFVKSTNLKGAWKYMVKIQGSNPPYLKSSSLGPPKLSEGIWVDDMISEKFLCNRVRIRGLAGLNWLKNRLVETIWKIVIYTAYMRYIFIWKYPKLTYGFIFDNLYETLNSSTVLHARWFLCLNTDLNGKFWTFNRSNFALVRISLYPKKKNLSYFDCFQIQIDQKSFFSRKDLFSHLGLKVALFIF